MQLPLTLPLQVKEGLEEVEKRLSNMGFNNFRDTKLSTASLHLIKAGGKLVRPALVLLGSYATNGINAKTIEAAVAVELIHTASLIHDDLIDKDDLRRGVVTVHKLFGEEFAVLSGDLLISKAIELSASCGEDAIKELARAAMDMCEGEARDFEAQASGSVLELNDYLEVVRLKTASLISASAAIGGLVSNAHPNDVDLLREYGRNLGMAFQIRDDYFNALGLFADKPKSTGNDLHRNRPNVISSLMLEMNLKEALEFAIRLNRSYIESAKNTVKALGVEGELLASYSEYMLIEVDSVEF